MKNFRIRFSLIFLIGGLLLQACTGTGTGGTVGQTLNPPDRLSTQELEALFRARTDSVRMRVHEADVQFMTGMISHHAQALVMSGFAPTNGSGRQVRTLAARIINAQKDEIAFMQQWLLDRRQPVPEVDETGQAVHAMHMPGMLSPEQLQNLENAKGLEFDRLFLTYMIQHHEGAVTMVYTLFATDGAALDDIAFKLASDIQVDQITEVARMRSMLEALPAPELNR
ncbi:MAG: DUF305 domain-containing protein [Gemmatimonadota bacterium]|nr:DUF305 domain-containing protein [Gemmatimonadota bacterium]